MSFYSSIVSLYDHIFPVMAPMVSLCNESVPQSGRVLEVGCATGNLIDALRNGKRSFAGIDYDDEMVKYSLKRFLTSWIFLLSGKYFSKLEKFLLRLSSLSFVSIRCVITPS